MRALLLFLLTTITMAAGVAHANVSVDPGTGQVNANYTIGIGYTAEGQAAPGGSYSYPIAVDASASGEAAPGRPASSGAGVSWGGLVRHYRNNTLLAEQELGPGLSDGYVTVTETETATRTVTVTYTYTTTGPGGQPTVITKVRTVTVPGEPPDRRVVLAGAGLLALLVLAALAARR